VLPSFYVSGDKARAWSVTRAAACGALLGLAVASFKTLGALYQTVVVSLPEIVGATAGFALLCAGASALRNVLARHLIWPESR
jgi:hypothetical protein